MGRDHFKQSMFSPYFNSHHYKTDSHEGQIERKIEKRLKKILAKFGLIRGENDEWRYWVQKKNKQRRLFKI